MGLFSNNKKLCPICGSPTPRLLATKVEDMPLCKECAGKVDLPDGVLARMSLDQFKKYIAYYDENQALRDMFKETDRMGFGFLSGELLAEMAGTGEWLEGERFSSYADEDEIVAWGRSLIQEVN